MKDSKVWLKKIQFILFLGLSLLVIVESLTIIEGLEKTSLILPLPGSRQVKPLPGSLKLVLEENQTVQPQQNLAAKIMFDGGGETVAGVDAVLTFDPKALALITLEGNPDLFEQILINRHQEDQGRLKITAYLPKKLIKDQATLAFLTFRLLKSESTVLGIEFRGVNTTQDSNLVSQKNNQDVLGRVASLILQIKEENQWRQEKNQ